jgi:putative transcriptional regulator
MKKTKSTNPVDAGASPASAEGVSCLVGTGVGPPSRDWTLADAMTDEEIHAAAISDPDAQPLTQEDFERMKRTPQVRVIRRALGLSQEEFATRFRIPIGTLRDWEQGRKDPDTAARAYLRVIGYNPAVVTEALLQVRPRGAGEAPFRAAPPCGRRTM